VLSGKALAESIVSRLDQWTESVFDPEDLRGFVSGLAPYLQLGKYPVLAEQGRSQRLSVQECDHDSAPGGRYDSREGVYRGFPALLAVPRRPVAPGSAAPREHP
jgi:hypothetical protein